MEVEETIEEREQADETIVEGRASSSPVTYYAKYSIEIIAFSGIWQTGM